MKHDRIIHTELFTMSLHLQLELRGTCAQGHPLSDYVTDKRGKRYCPSCARAKNLANYHRNKHKWKSAPKSSKVPGNRADEETRGE